MFYQSVVSALLFNLQTPNVKFISGFQKKWIKSTEGYRYFLKCILISFFFLKENIVHLYMGCVVMTLSDIGFRKQCLILNLFVPFLKS